MDRKKVIAGSLIAIAVLLPVGKWVVASPQDAADRKQSQEIEKQFASRNGADTGGTPRQGAEAPGVQEAPARMDKGVGRADSETRVVPK